MIGVDLGVLGRLQWEIGKECAWALLVLYSSKDGMGACFVLCSPVTESMGAFSGHQKGLFVKNTGVPLGSVTSTPHGCGCGIRSGKLLGSF
jgi:hypothetical protein